MSDFLNGTVSCELYSSTRWLGLLASRKAPSIDVTYLLASALLIYLDLSLVMTEEKMRETKEEK